MRAFDGAERTRKNLTSERMRRAVRPVYSAKVEDLVETTQIEKKNNRGCTQRIVRSQDGERTRGGILLSPYKSRFGIRRAGGRR